MNNCLLCYYEYVQRNYMIIDVKNKMSKIRVSLRIKILLNPTGDSVNS